MAITFVAASAGEDITVGAAVTLPAEVQAGHRLLAVLETNSISGYSHLPPAGWSLVSTSHGSAEGGSQFSSVFTKVAEPADAGARVTFTVTPSGSRDVLVVAAYAGTLTTPVISAAAVQPHTGASSTTIAVPVLDIGELPALLVTAATKKGGTAAITLTPPTGFGTSPRVAATTAASGACAAAIADAPAPAAGDTAVGPWMATAASAAATGFLIALTEGPPPAPRRPLFQRLTVDGWYPPAS